VGEPEERELTTDAARGTVSLTASAGIRGRRLVALVVLCTAFLLTVMAATSVMTAAPSIAQAFHLGSGSLQWSLTAATVPGAALVFVGGWLADRFGRRRMVLGGLALFMVSSLACGAAPNAVLLVVARLTQGAAAALLIPAALALLCDTFSSDHDRHRAVATWSAVGGTGATLGLVLGGLVTTGLGWRWVFVVNGPVCLLLLAGAIAVLNEAAERRPSRHIDTLGAVSISLAVAALLYAIGLVPSTGLIAWRPLLAAFVAAGSFVVFFARQVRGRDSLIPPRILRSPVVQIGVLTLLLAGILVDGLLYTLTLLLQDVRGYSALQYGGVAALMAAVSVLAAGASQRLVTRYGPRLVGGGGLVALALTCFLLRAGASTHVPIAVVLAAMVVFGLGMGAAFVAGSVATLSVDQRDSATAGALQDLCFSLGTALGVAVLSTVVAASGHIGGRPFASAGPAKLLSGIRTALWVATALAGFGAVGLALLRAGTGRGPLAVMVTEEETP